MTSEARVRRFAEDQRGLVTYEQLRACGFSDKQIHSRRKRGALVPLLPGVFKLGGTPDSIEIRLQAVALWMGKDGFFNGATAAYVMGLDAIDPPQTISVCRYSGLRGPGWIKVRRLHPSDRPATRSVNGFRVCSVERALAECCADIAPRRVGRAIDAALRERLTTFDRLQAFARTWSRGRRGATIFHTLVRARDERDEKIRSLFESKMLAILRRIREHRFLPDFEITPAGARYFVDFYLPEAALGLECHSRRWHLGRHDADAKRDRRIRSLGIELLYFTWDDVCHHSDEVEAEIRAAIARRLATSSALLPHTAQIAEENT